MMEKKQQAEKKTIFTPPKQQKRMGRAPVKH